MFAVRSVSSLASLVATSGILSVIAIGLSFQTGIHAPPTQALQVFNVAPPAPSVQPSKSPHTSAAQSAPLRPATPSVQVPALPPVAAPALLAHVTPPTPSSPVAAPPASGAPAATAPTPAPMSAPAVAAKPQPPARLSGTSPYSSRVLAWLEQHKYFPRDGARDRLDATVMVSFSIDRRGRAQDIRVVGSSGLGWLDSLALRQVRSASPFPKPPEPGQLATLNFQVPMRYRARA